MPVIAASAAAALLALGRQLIIALVTLGIWQFLGELLQTWVEQLKEKFRTSFNLSEDDARTLVANYVIDTVEGAGILVAILKSRLPVKTADYLGFTTKGYAKRALSAEAVTKVGTQSASVATIEAAAPQALAAAESAVAASRGVSLASVKNITQIAATIIGTPVAVFYAFAQYLDYAAWQNPYQHTMQNLLAKIGIDPDSGMPKAGTLSPDSWKQIYSTVEALAPTSIKSVTRQQSLIYSRDNLADVIDEVAAQIRLTGAQATVRNVLALALPLVHVTGGVPVTSTSTSPTTTTPPPNTIPQQVQIYTGVVASGVLGAPAEFVSRPSDMIQNTDDLKAAAKNNLASLVTALPNKFYYELSIQNTFKTKGGTTQKGAPVRVVTGYYKNGAPRYKTVYFKWAVLRVGVTDWNGRTVKLAEINLGPVDVVAYTPTQTDLTSIQNSITPELFTSDISQVTQIVTSKPVSITPSAPTPTAPTTQNSQPVTTQPVYTPSGGAIIPQAPAPTPPPAPAAPVYAPTSVNLTPTTLPSSVVAPGAIPIAQFVGYNIPNGAVFSYNGTLYTRNGEWVITAPGYPAWAASPIDNFRIQIAAPVAQPAATPALTSTQLAMKNASTLSEWYLAQGQALPALGVRAADYQSYGLGAAATYAGTAEQNNRLLVEYKRSARLI